MSLTTATQNNSKVPFPFQQEDDDATKLHPRVEAKLNVAKRLSEIKTHLPFKTTQGQSLLEKLASGTLDDYITEQATIQDDSWLNSGPPIQEHLEPPDWLEVLLRELREMPIKEPPEIDAEQLQKVKEGLDKLKEEAEKTLKNHEQSLLDTGLVESLMSPEASSQDEEATDSSIQAEPIMSDTEGYDEVIEATPTACIPAVRASTPRLAPTPIQERPITPNPITPIPVILQQDYVASEPKLEAIQEKNSDAIKPNRSSYRMVGIRPLTLVYGAIFEHVVKYQKTPIHIFVSKRFINFLSIDIKDSMNALFKQYIPFPSPEGTVFIPVKIDENMGIASHTVDCIS